MTSSAAATRTIKAVQARKISSLKTMKIMMMEIASEKNQSEEENNLGN